MRRPGNRRKRLAVSGASVLLVLLVWQIAPQYGLIRPSDVGQPLRIAQALAGLLRSGDFWQNARISLDEFVLGFAMASVAGIVIGAALGRWRSVSLLFEPLLMACYTTPRLALLPILVVLFGAEGGAVVAVVFLEAVFPILVNTAVGVREVDAVLVRAVRSFGGTEIDVFRQVLLPGSLASISAGFRLAVGRALMGLVVGEMFAAPTGIGGEIQTYGSAFRTSHLMALVGVVAVVGYLSVGAMRRVERRLGHAAAEP